jgi:uncharacterized protein (DUF169 family)
VRVVLLLWFVPFELFGTVSFFVEKNVVCGDVGVLAHSRTIGFMHEKIGLVFGCKYSIQASSRFSKQIKIVLNMHEFVSISKSLETTNKQQIGFTNQIPI